LSDELKNYPSEPGYLLSNLTSRQCRALSCYGNRASLPPLGGISA